MARMQVLTELTKGSEFPWMNDSYIWQDDAACAFQPPTLFEIARWGDPVTEGLEAGQLHSLNVENLKAAKKVCDSCPVWHECYSSADPTDFRETMRAGIMPINFQVAPQGRPANDPTKPCQGGHPLESWRLRKNRNQWYCKDCHREGSTRGKKGGRRKNDPTQPCRNGHELRHWKRHNKTKNGGWECSQCIRDYRGVEERVLSRTCPKGHEEWAYRKNGARWCRACSRGAKVGRPSRAKAASVAA